MTDVISRLQAAINDHDLDALVDCFAPRFVSEQPAYPGRGFAGREDPSWAARCRPPW